MGRARAATLVRQSRLDRTSARYVPECSCLHLNVIAGPRARCCVAEVSAALRLLMRCVAQALRVPRPQRAGLAGVLRLRVLPPPELDCNRDLPLLGEALH